MKQLTSLPRLIALSIPASRTACEKQDQSEVDHQGLIIIVETAIALRVISTTLKEQRYQKSHLKQSCYSSRQRAYYLAFSTMRFVREWIFGTSAEVNGVIENS
jgi:hypothetical protein